MRSVLRVVVASVHFLFGVARTFACTSRRSTFWRGRWGSLPCPCTPNKSGRIFFGSAPIFVCRSRTTHLRTSGEETHSDGL